MTQIYVLLILSHIYGGMAVHTHEFSSLETCEKAKQFFISQDGFTYGHRFVECVKK